MLNGWHWSSGENLSSAGTVPMSPRGVEQYTAFIGCYEIDVEAIRQSSGMLDWIFQIGGKTWATARVTKDLINAFDSVFHPQHNLCSGGSNKIIQNPRAFLRHRIETVGKDGPLKDAAGGTPR